MQPKNTIAAVMILLVLFCPGAVQAAPIELPSFFYTSTTCSPGESVFHFELAAASGSTVNNFHVEIAGEPQSLNEQINLPYPGATIVIILDVPVSGNPFYPIITGGGDVDAQAVPLANEGQHWNPCAPLFLPMIAR